MFRLDGKVAVVTGASRGIGRAIAEALAEQGAKVAVGWQSREDAAAEVVAGIAARGGQAEALRIDVADISAEKAIEEVARRLGRLDALVANAGIAIDGLVLRVKREELERTFAVNVFGAIACARAALKTMMRARAGRVVFVSSVVGETGNAGQVAYAASKAALLGTCRSLAREFASRGVTVNAVAPGFVETDMTRRIEAEAREELVRQIPLGRIGDPRDVAAAVAWLCSDEAGWTTGQTLRVNGGMHMA